MSRAAARHIRDLQAEVRRLRRENAALRRRAAARAAKLEAEKLALEQRVRALTRQLWGKKSERSSQPEKTAAAPAQPPAKRTSDQPRRRQKPGPRPLDPALRREVIKLPDPAPEHLICPVSGERLQPGFIETIEVLACLPASYYVKRFERTVFVSHAKSAPIYTPWPENVFPRSRVDASIFAQIAAEHYCEHAPFHRIEKRLARAGVRLSRVTQIALMKKLDQLVAPAAAAIKLGVMKSGYIHLDATPVPLCDPARPGGTVESTVWGYRVNGEPLCWYQFEYQRGKSPDHPDRELKAANFAGLLQVDGAGGLSAIGRPNQVIALGCHSHARRYAIKAFEDGDLNAQPYLAGFNRLFRLDRLAKYFKLTAAHKHQLRLEHSLPLFELLVAMAEVDRLTVPPKTPLAECLTYLLEQQEYLRRCITIRGAELTNNAAERSLRPLKMGVKNWQWIGHPKAGPRLANLFTLIENCRQVGADVAAYLTDLVTRLPSQPASKIAELLPAAWKRARDEAKSSADPPAA